LISENCALGPRIDFLAFFKKKSGGALNLNKRLDETFAGDLKVFAVSWFGAGQRNRTGAPEVREAAEFQF